ncbi:UNKNOWN [Stylonychia lemnae]|uniref:Uncharacterized protein n=1 Tax=Stylonychia lemnae TaxID=5949 RepID=A0A078APS7_STYLE|nr:UNKNOWN [Stylonychia lemnae]|eukprot:CDW84169.1 UNKNOWN [Stylonychia lemnae]
MSTLPNENTQSSQASNQHQPKQIFSVEILSKRSTQNQNNAIQLSQNFQSLSPTPIFTIHKEPRSQASDPTNNILIKGELDLEQASRKPNNTTYEEVINCDTFSSAQLAQNQNLTDQTYQWGQPQKSRGRRKIAKLVENSDIVSLKRNIFRSHKYIICNNVNGFTFKLRKKYEHDKSLLKKIEDVIQMFQECCSYEHQKKIQGKLRDGNKYYHELIGDPCYRHNTKNIIKFLKHPICNLIFREAVLENQIFERQPFKISIIHQIQELYKAALDI